MTEASSERAEVTSRRSVFPDDLMPIVIHSRNTMSRAGYSAEGHHVKNNPQICRNFFDIKSR